MNRSPKNTIISLLHRSFSKMDIIISSIPIEYPENREHGHYSSPIAMVLAKTLKKNPRIVAEELLADLVHHKMFEKIEIAGPGYLNFFLSDDYLSDKLDQINTQPFYGANDNLSDCHILLEYVSANPTGPLHIGHGRWAVVGDSLARLLKYCGAEVHREFYVNDAGVQIVHLKESVTALQTGQPIPEDGYRGAYIQELANEVAETHISPEILMQESQKKTLARFHTEFDRWFSEKMLHKPGIMEEVFDELKQKDAVYELDGAWWFRSREYSKDDKDRVVIKSDGSYTYFASDIVYHANKIKRGFPLLINILGFDHHGYVERISGAVKVLGGNLTVLLGQMVNLFRNGEPVRMSKRTGDMISLDEVIEEIGVDAVRYLLLRRSMNSAVDFDLEAAKIANDQNPVFYVQYAHARICSILENTKAEAKFERFSHRDEILLFIELIKFEDLILEISHSYDLHKLPIYLESVASLFHRFYRSCRIIDASEEKSRLALCKAVKKILHAGLSLLGVSAPEKMFSRNSH